MGKIIRPAGYRTREEYLAAVARSEKRLRDTFRRAVRKAIGSPPLDYVSDDDVQEATAPLYRSSGDGGVAFQELCIDAMIAEGYTREYGGYRRKVERDMQRRRSARDIQVIIKDSGSSKPRQRWDPKKAKKRKGKFVRRKPFGGNFEAAMRKKYGDQATTLNTETQRDPQSPLVALVYRTEFGHRTSRRGRQYSFATIEEFRKWASRKPYVNERLLVIPVRNRYPLPEFRCEGWAAADRLQRALGSTSRVPAMHKYSRHRSSKKRALRVTDDLGYYTRNKDMYESAFLGSLRPRLSRKSRTSRDFEDDVRHLSLSALGRLLRQFHQRGDEAKCHIIEKEIDRRTKSFRGRR